MFKTRFFKYLFITILCLISHSIYSQSSKIDSAYALSKIAKQYIEEDIAIGHVSNNNIELFKKNVLIFDSIYKNIDNLQLQGTNYYLKSILSKTEKRFDEAELEAKRAVSIFKKVKDTIQVNRNLLLAIDNSLAISEPDVAAVLAFFNDNKDWININTQYSINYELAQYYQSIEDFETAIKYLQKSREISDSIGDSYLKGEVHYMASKIYQRLDDFDEAELNALDAIKYLDKERSLFHYNANFFNLGQIYRHKGEYDNAIIYLDSASNNFKKINATIAVAKIQSEKAFCLFKLERFDEAEKTIKSVIRTYRSSNRKRLLIYPYSRLGNILFYKDNNSDSAIYYMKESLALSKKHQIKSEIRASNYNLSNFYYAQRKYKDARDHLKIAYAYRDTLYKQDLSNRLKVIEAQYEDEKQKNTILEKEKDLALEREGTQTLKNKQQRLTAILLIISSITIFIGYLLYKRKKQLEIEKYKYLQEVTKVKELIKTQQENGKLNQEKEYEFHKKLKKKYKLTKAPLEYWIDQANGISEKEMMRKYSLSSNAIESRRKRLYEKIKDIEGIDPKIWLLKQESVRIYKDNRQLFYI